MLKRDLDRPAPDAEALALTALTFLAEDPARLGRFLSLTGIGPADLRRAADAPHTLAAVLEYLLADESLLLVFASEKGVRPEAVGRAHAALAVAENGFTKENPGRG